MYLVNSEGNPRMRNSTSVLALSVVVISMLSAAVCMGDCPCMDMTSTACRQWGSSGTSFYWITDSNPSSSITLTAGACGQAGESGTAYIYSYLNASSGHCDDDYDTPCDGNTTSHARYAKIKVIGSQEAYQHIFPGGLSFTGCYNYGGETKRFSSLTISETNTECDLRLSINQVMRIVLRASVSHCNSEYSGSKFTIQVKFYEARNDEQTKFSLLDSATGSITVVQNQPTSFDPQNFIPDVREGTANGWIEKTTYDLSDDTTDSRWKVTYRNRYDDCDDYTEGLEYSYSSKTLIDDDIDVFRVKLPGFKRSIHGLPAYASQEGWSYVLGTEGSYIQYNGDGGKIIFHCTSPADNSETNKRYLITRVESCTSSQDPDEGTDLWTLSYTYNSPATISCIHNGNDANTVDSATAQYDYQWDSDAVEVSYKTRSSTAGSWDTDRQWDVEFDSEGRAAKYDAGCSSCSGSGGYQNVIYIDPGEHDITGYEYLIAEKMDANGTVILQNSYDFIDYGEYFPAYSLSIHNGCFEYPYVTYMSCEDQTGDFVGWEYEQATPTTPYVQICNDPNAVYDGEQCLTLGSGNENVILNEFSGWVSPETNHSLSVQIKANSASSSATVELYYHLGTMQDRVLLTQISESVSGGGLVQGQWEGCYGSDIDYPEELLVTGLPTDVTFVIRVSGNDVSIDDVQLAASIWVAGASKPIITEQKVYDDTTSSLKTVLTRDYDKDTYIVTEKKYISDSDYRLTEYHYEDEKFNTLLSHVEYEELSGDALTGDSFTTTYSSDDPNRIFVTTYPNEKRTDIQIFDEEGNLTQSYIWNLENDANALMQTYVYESGYDYTYGYSESETDTSLETSKLVRQINPRGGTTTYNYINQNGAYVVQTQTDPATPFGQQVIEYTYDDARRVIQEIRKLDDSRTLGKTYNYNSTTGFLDSVRVNGAATYYTYNDFGQVTRETNPDGVVTGKSYGTGGELLSEFVIDENSDPNLADTTLTLVSQIRYTYTDEGEIETIGKYKSDTSFSYQSDMTTNPDNWIITKYEYYTNGRKKKVIEDYGTNRTNLTTEYFYNYQGEISKVLYPTGKWVKTTKDGRGLTLLEETGYGSSTVVLETSYAYDDNGNLTDQINPDGSSLVYEYDNYDRLVKTYKLSLSGPYTETTYNSAGDVIRQVVFEDDATMLSDVRMGYDTLGQLYEERACADPNVLNDTEDMLTRYIYDIAGNLRYEVKAGIGVSSLGISEPNDLSEPDNTVTEYIYNNQGRRIHTIDPQQIMRSVFYTDAGLPKTIVDPNDPTDPNAFITQNIYDAYGRLEKAIDPMGHYTLYTYNSLNQITKQYIYDCNDTPDDLNDDYAVAQKQTTYDNLGNVTRQAVMAAPASTGSIQIGVDLVTDYVFDPNDGLLKQQKTYYGTAPSTATTSFGYDSIGRRITTTDAEGNIETTTYSTSAATGSQVEKVQSYENDLDGSNDYTVTTFFEYDSFGRLYKQILDEDGDGESESSDQTTTYTYDGLDRVKTETANDDVVTYYEYDSFGNVKTKIEDYGTSTENRQTDFVYNRLNQLYQVKAYNPDLETSQVVTQTTTYEYDKNGNNIKITYPDNESVEYSYNLFNKLNSEIQRDGTWLAYWYDWDKNLTLINDYDPADPNCPNSSESLAEEFDYDAAGNLIEATKEIDGSEISKSVFTYNGFGARTSEVATYYESLISKTTSWTYDGSGNTATQTHGNTTLTYTHDGLGRIDTIGKNGTQIVAYDYIGKNTEAIDYPQADTSENFYYDELGRIEECKSIDPDSETLLDFQYTYDEVGNRQQCKYNHLATPVYDKYYYDTLNRLYKVEYAQSSGFALVPVEDTTGIDIDQIVPIRNIQLIAQIAYDILENDYSPTLALSEYIPEPTASVKQRLEQIKQMLEKSKLIAYGDFIESAYTIETFGYHPDDPVLTLSVVVDSNELLSNYKTESIYDANNRLIAQITTDSEDRLVIFIMYPNDGGTILYSIGYDKRGDISAKTLTSFDAEGNLAEVVDVLAQEETLAATASMASLSSTSLSASTLSMESSAVVMTTSTAEAPETASEEFTYDHLGNRYEYVDKLGYTTTYEHNIVNQYSEAVTDYIFTSDTVTYSHDDNGNLETNDSGNTYVYDYRNRLVEVDANSVTVAEYVYDALGRRIIKSIGSESTYFFYDAQGRIISEYESTTDITKEYVYGNGINEVLAMFTPYNAGSTSDWSDFLEFCDAWLCGDPNACYDSNYDHNSDDVIDMEDFGYFASIWDIPSNQESDWYYIHDALGSVRAIVGGRFEREDDYEFYNYDVYGQLSIEDGEESQSCNTILFAGYYFDPETGFYHTQYRTYDPDTGRWLQFDPEGYTDGYNLYEYVSSNSIMFIDPFGLESMYWTPGGVGFPVPTQKINMGGLASSHAVTITGKEHGEALFDVMQYVKQILEENRSQLSVSMPTLSADFPVGTIGPFGQVRLGLEASGAVKGCCYCDGPKNGKQGAMFVGDVGIFIKAGASSRVKFVNKYSSKSGRNLGKQAIDTDTGKQIHKFDQGDVSGGLSPSSVSLSSNKNKCRSEIKGYVKVSAYANLDIGFGSASANAPIMNCDAKGCKWSLKDFSYKVAVKKDFKTVGGEAWLQAKGGYNGSVAFPY